MLSRSLGHRAPLLWLVLPACAGLAAGHAGLTLPRPTLWVIAALASAASLAATPRHARIWAATVSLAAFCLGLDLYRLQRARLPVWDTLPPREAHLDLRVDHVFPSPHPGQSSGLATVVGADPHLADLVGQRIHFSLSLRPGEPAPVRTAVTRALGVIIALPRNPAGHSFDAHLAAAGMNFRLSRGRLTGTLAPASAYHQACARLAAACHRFLGLGLEPRRPELAALLRALMLGSTQELSGEQKEVFMQSGTMHLFAISGLNIGVIATALHAILSLLRLPTWARCALGLTVLWVFVDVTGASPSAIRAFAMAAFLQAATVLRQPANLLSALTVSAFGVLLLAPLQVFSTSFLLSYGIVATLLLIGAPLGDAWLNLWSPGRDVPPATWTLRQHFSAWAWRRLAPTFAVGLATSLAGLLAGLEFFQLLTPGALLTNLVLIPAASLTTFAGFISLLCGAAGLSSACILCNHAAGLLLLGIEHLVRLSVRVPGAFVHAQFSSAWIGPCALAGLLALLLFGYHSGWKTRRGGWWPPFVLVALTLLLGVRFG